MGEFILEFWKNDREMAELLVGEGRGGVRVMVTPAVTAGGEGGEGEIVAAAVGSSEYIRMIRLSLIGRKCPSLSAFDSFTSA